MEEVITLDSCPDCGRPTHQTAARVPMMGYEEARLHPRFPSLLAEEMSMRARRGWDGVDYETLGSMFAGALVEVRAMLTGWDATVNLTDEELAARFVPTVYVDTEAEEFAISESKRTAAIHEPGHMVEGAA